jgi:acyl-CoA thioesterase-1
VNKIYGALAAGLQWLSGAIVLALALAMLPPPAAAAPVPQRTILVLGDSLSAGYGLANGEGWVALTAKQLPKSNPGWQLVNASISGETSAGGAARIAHELRLHHPDVVVVELGANDGLRGLDSKQLRANLARIVQLSQASGARVLVIGMRMPPNFGARYTREFEAVFADTAKAWHTAYLPFLLAPVANDRNAFQADDMHPVAAAQPKLRDYVWTQLRPLLSASAAAKPARAARASGG